MGRRMKRSNDLGIKRKKIKLEKKIQVRKVGLKLEKGMV